MKNIYKRLFLLFLFFLLQSFGTINCADGGTQNAANKPNESANNNANNPTSNTSNKPVNNKLNSPPNKTNNIPTKIEDSNRHKKTTINEVNKLNNTFNKISNSDLSNKTIVKENDNNSEYWLFVGNTSTGKSTIINALAGKIVTKKGRNTRTHIITDFISYNDVANKRIYLDTPGLNHYNAPIKSDQKILIHPF